ncbi:MAG: TIGR02281 family clan AA aspartic protease [Rhodocyclales bacterium]|nr:TIGR02281 family clan AA aspartic protease [Rhodocyclales bacterium]
MHILRNLWVVAAVCAVPLTAWAADVALIGVFGSKAVLSIDGGPPRTIKVGQKTPEGVKLVELSDQAAVIDVGSGAQRIALGAAAVRVGSAASGAEATLTADARGHFYGNASINGQSMRFLVDTGATMVSMGASEARRAGLNPSDGTQVHVQTANGVARAWHLRLDTIMIEGIKMHGVDALVHEGELPIVLLGMSFLNRVDMKREGGRMVLRKRY